MLSLKLPRVLKFTLAGREFHTLTMMYTSYIEDFGLYFYHSILVYHGKNTSLKYHGKFPMVNNKTKNT